ncbi:glycosyltransferase family 2 protein [Actinomyces howellii]|uniref:UDP-galactofuranosyl transferase GlfT1 n=1 Tax=Actinomyces howellii TaxID=52771 RepID=A0A448HK29_9ACTO|nr:glycosyltransferase family 2 protein [Actinomyces howellii]VEG29899.1 UDP-galactofuranosyl transferase GlfT1 [Actinomyces howellii]
MTGAGRDVAAVVVTYHPEGDCAELLEALAGQCRWVIVVDNGSLPEELEPVRSACAAVGALLVELGRNTGIAAAQNRGVVEAERLGARWVLLSDDDSAPAEGMVSLLMTAFEAPGQRPVAAVGPLVGEDRGGRDQLVYVARRWGPRRATAEELGSPFLEVAFLIASGCLVDLHALREVGPMNEDLFIDHVDLEWGLRARRAGYRLLVVPRARMTHSLGDEVVRIPGRRQPVHMHGPVRNYYLARNTVALIRSGLLPVAWRVGYAVWITKYSAFNALVADRRGQRARALVEGLRDGLVGRTGPRP